MPGAISPSQVGKVLTPNKARPMANNAPDFTKATLENLNAYTAVERDRMVAQDLADLQHGRLTEETLLARCLDGAEPEWVTGWREYVAAIVGATPPKNAKDLVVGTKIKIADGFGTTYAVVVEHSEARWGYECLVQIVESHCEGRTGSITGIHGSETRLGIGWKVCAFIVVNDEVREVSKVDSLTRYSLVGGQWVEYYRGDGAWFLGVMDQRCGPCTVRL
jgi:hypothetical protein